MYEIITKNIDASYEYAKEIYAALGVNTDDVIKRMEDIHISLHCWQGDDVTGFEEDTKSLSGGGILATGNYPGKARNGDELRQDLEKAMELIPGDHRVNLHMIYAETDGKAIPRDEISIEHFSRWLNWAVEKKIGLDFNPSLFSHPLAASGYTLSHQDENIRNFWIRHALNSREIAAEFGRKLGTASVNNIWIPDGSKDIPADRLGYRKILKESLDTIFEKKYDPQHLIDAVECKLFGIGSESYVVGSHEFYMGYAMGSNTVIPCFDMGHFHPTENVADKISSALIYKEKLLLHVSRGVRWDSDHVVILNDDLLALSHELKRCNAYGKVSIALDFFDASINRITAWVTGTRSALKAILISLLEPTDLLLNAEKTGNLGDRLALLEEFKTLPFGAVWNKYCQKKNVAVGPEWLNTVKNYEKTILSTR